MEAFGAFDGSSNLPRATYKPKTLEATPKAAENQREYQEKLAQLSNDNSENGGSEATEAQSFSAAFS
jgi:hypothetical protein